MTDEAKGTGLNHTIKDIALSKHIDDR